MEILKEILAEIKKLNEAVAYQTKLFEYLFEQKDNNRAVFEERKRFLQTFTRNMADTFRSKNVDPAPFFKMLGGLNGLIDEGDIGENKK